MTRTLLLAALATLLLASAPLRAADAIDRKAELARVSAYLNTIKNAQGEFVQIGPDGSSDQGTFYLSKPGRLRFDYAAPNPTLVVSDGSTIAVENEKLKTTDRYPLVDSPLKLLLSESVDLAKDPRITRVAREPGTLTVTARQDSGAAQGAITLYFADDGSSLELRQWEVEDAQGLRTLVALHGLRQGVSLSPALFQIRELSPFQKR
jgi:outer membrane lipoprotein-sorting protein